MFKKRVLQCLMIAIVALTASLPVHAAMVGTAQIQANTPVMAGDVTQQREWIREQLVKGGVDETVAVTRVAAMTDVQVAKIHQRIDEVPAGGGTAEVLIIIGLVLVITELMGYTDIIPNWPAE
jgi:hypothetical protein